MKTFDPTLGDLWHAASSGTYSPNVGKVDYTKEEAEEHNRMLSELRLEHMRESGRAVLYLTKNKEGIWWVSDFAGLIQIPAGQRRKSRNNFGATRIDTWFVFDGSIWHGVNVGDNDLLRCKRTKQKA